MKAVVFALSETQLKIAAKENLKCVSFRMSNQYFVKTTIQRFFLHWICYNYYYH